MNDTQKFSHKLQNNHNINMGETISKMKADLKKMISKTKHILVDRSKEDHLSDEDAEEIKKQK